MRRLPAGTVTLLFTDVEGSTLLLQQLGRDRYVEALSAHRRVLRETVDAHRGVEVEMQGDSFHFAFASARDAVAAAAAAQRGLAGDASAPGPVRVRMGLHTGEPLPVDGLYAGLDVHRAARVMAVGHGGQVLLSAATYELVCEDVPDGLSLRDLGSHRLKDLTLPQRLYQLCVAGLETDFPPLRSLENRPTNLPAQPTPLVGRERELGELGDLLLRDDVRLVTCTGPGGTGKTRLALQASADQLERRPDGVWFVNLAPLADPELVAAAIAQTLAVRERPGEPLRDTLGAHLRDRELLLVLDNYEHLLPAAPLVADLLAAAPGLDVLVTSRAPLRISGERVYAVPPLELPDPGELPRLERLSQYEAVTLFLERARASQPGFRLSDENAAAVAEICVRLDGLPLAIELAAARVRLLPPQALLARLGSRLGLLTSGARDAADRQRTLRAAVDWSYRLLAPGEQAVFRRAAVFAGGWSLEAAEAVCDPGRRLDVLESLFALADHSLIRAQQESGGEPRFTMLETIAEYARDELDGSGEADEIRLRHADHFAALATDSASGSAGRQQAERLRQVAADEDNVLAAFDTLLAAGHAERAVAVAVALFGFWEVSGRGDRMAEQALLRRALAAATSERPRLLLALGHVLSKTGDLGGSEAALEEARSSAAAAGDRAIELQAEVELAAVDSLRKQDDQNRPLLEVAERAEAELARLGDHAGASRAATWAAVALSGLGRPEDCTRAAERALASARRAGSVRHQAEALEWLSLALFTGPTPAEEAARRLERLLAEWEGVDSVQWFLSIGLGLARAYQGDFDGARELIGRGARLAHALELTVNAAMCGTQLGEVELLAGRPDAAERALRPALEAMEELGVDALAATVACALAKALTLQGRFEDALAAVELAEQRSTADDAEVQIGIRMRRSELVGRAGRHDEAVELAEAAVRLARETDAILLLADALVCKADALEAAGRPGAGEALRAALALWEAKGNRPLAERLRARIGGRPTP